MDTSLSSFILLPIDTAVEEGLFGPDPPVPSARPRLGDFVGLSTSNKTLVTPEVQSDLLGAQEYFRCINILYTNTRFFKGTF